MVEIPESLLTKIFNQLFLDSDDEFFAWLREEGARYELDREEWHINVWFDDDSTGIAFLLKYG